MKKLTPQEESLLLFCECAMVDYGGLYESCHLNNNDRDILDVWKSNGFADHGRIASSDIKGTRTVWVKLSAEAMQAAHLLRTQRAIRKWNKRTWQTAVEKRGESLAEGKE